VATTTTTVTPPPPKPQGFGEQLRSFNRAFWACNVMELIERWGYYGVRAVLSIYIVDAVSRGGLEFTHIQKGSIYAWWALIQSLLPLFTGGFADRYGYKNTVAFSIVIKIAGYLLMGTQHTYWGFFLGCMLLATGTAIFKPGIQGIIANETKGSNAAVGWGIFYAMVNIGGFIGPWAAGYLRVMDWSYVFFANAALVALNFLILPFFKEPERPSFKSGEAKNPFVEAGQILVVSVRHVFEPRLAAFLVLFSGFWLMFMQLFDLLPNFIDDWVDSSGLMLSIGQLVGNQGMIAAAQAGHQIQPEWMINIDAGAIVFLMVPIAALFSRMKALHSIILGILISIIGIVTAGTTMNGSLVAFGIFIFAVGEMMASPKKQEYLSAIAPPDKKGLYMGYANVPLAIGWGIGSSIGGYMYQAFGDKVTLAKQYMVTKLNMSQATIDALPKEEVMTTLAAQLGKTPREATDLLFAVYQPQHIWYIFGAVGLASMIGLVIYDRVLAKLDSRKTAA
jgi:MFS family permease